MRLTKHYLRNQIADSIAGMMTRRGYTRNTMVELAGCSHATLSAAVDGTRDLKVSTLVDLLDVLGLQLRIVPKTR